MGFIQVDPKSIKLDGQSQAVSPSMVLAGAPPPVPPMDGEPKQPEDKKGGFVEVDPNNIKLDGQAQVGALEDVARSGASGIVHGLPTAIDVPAAALATGIEKLTGSKGTMADLFRQNLGNGINAGISKHVTGPEYQPQTEAGILAKGAGAAVGSLPLGGAGALEQGVPMALARSVSAGVGGTALGQAGGSIGEQIGGDTGRKVGQIAGNVVGGVLGAKFPGAPGAIAKATAPIASAIKTATVGRNADQILQDIIQKSGKTPEELKSALEAGQISTLADIGGDTVQGLTRAVAKTTPGKDIVADALNSRADDAVKRVSDDLSKNVSGVDKYFTNLDDVSKARAVAAAPLYKQAYQEGAELNSPDLNKYLQDSRVQAAQNEARRSYGVPLEAKPNSIESLDGVKKVLDDQISSAMQGGQKNLAGSLLELKNGMVKVLDDASPAYAQARKVFGGLSQMQNAQKMGADFSTKTPEQLGMMLKNMPADQKEAFRIGVRENLQNTVNKTADGADPAKRIFGNTQKRAQLEQVFDNPKNFQDFQTRMNEEIQGASTKQRVLGGSRTDYNIAADDELGQLATNAVKKGVTRSILDAGMDKASEFISKRYYGITDANSKYIANALVNREEGIKALDNLIAKSSGQTKQAATAAKSAIQDAVSSAPNPAAKPSAVEVLAGNAPTISRSVLRDAPDPSSKPMRIEIGKRAGRK